MEPRPWRPYMKQEEEGVSSCGGIPWGRVCDPAFSMSLHRAVTVHRNHGGPAYGFHLGFSILPVVTALRSQTLKILSDTSCPSQETPDPNASSSSSDITNFHCSSRGPRALGIRPQLETDDGRNLELFRLYRSKELVSRGKSRDFS